MGLIFSNIWDKLFNKLKDVRMVMVGLDAAGKTTIMYKMKLGETPKTIPTIGFNVETIEYKKLTMTIWDIGGQDKLRGLWHHYYENTQALIYVVDSADIDRMDIAREELFKALNSLELENAPLLVYANKQDLPEALTPDQIIEKLNLRSLKGRSWLVQGTTGTEGKGLTEGLDWMAETLYKQSKK